MIKQIIFDFDGVLYPSTEENMQRILSNISLAVNKTKKIPSQDLLNEVKLPIKGTKIGILGLSYKANVNDLRESPSFKIISPVTK
jgi:UDP-N-acetyl-D-mannosaminuronate dehydrogenase